MRPFKAAFFIFVGANFIMLLNSCGAPEEKTKTDSVVMTNPDTTSVSAQMPVFQPGMTVVVQTFEVTDSLGKKSEGWGYDLIVGTKKVIHQPIRPALPGNNGFASEEDARKMGELAAKRFSETGSFPVIKLSDYDSLHIKQ